jgi:hypothetical protein
LPGSELMSSFTQHELYSYYSTLFTFSRKHGCRYISGFESMLCLMNVNANEKIIKQWLSVFSNNPTFPQFLIVFNKIVESALKESVMDYFEIMFENYQQESIGYCTLLKLLGERMSESQAADIS